MGSSKLLSPPDVGRNIELGKQLKGFRVLPLFTFLACIPTLDEDLHSFLVFVVLCLIHCTHELFVSHAFSPMLMSFALLGFAKKATRVLVRFLSCIFFLTLSSVLFPCCLCVCVLNTTFDNDHVVT